MSPSDIPTIAKLPEGTEAHVGQTWTYRAWVGWCIRCESVVPIMELCSNCGPESGDHAVPAVLATGIVTAVLPVVEWQGRVVEQRCIEVVTSVYAREWYPNPNDPVAAWDGWRHRQIERGADPQPGETWVVLDVTPLDEPQTTEPCNGDHYDSNPCNGSGRVPVSGPDGWRADS